MTFTKRLREGVSRGEITCSVRIWTRPHMRVGARDRMEEGEIQVDSIQPIGFPDITPELARESGRHCYAIRWIRRAQARRYVTAREKEILTPLAKKRERVRDNQGVSVTESGNGEK